MNKLMGLEQGQQELMDGYDVEQHRHPNPGWMDERYKITVSYRVYRFETNEISGNVHVKVYKFGYPDYKSMIQKHPELKVLQLI